MQLVIQLSDVQRITKSKTCMRRGGLRLEVLDMDCNCNACMEKRRATSQEIKNCLFSIGGLKAPEPDGIPAKFFQAHWSTCKDDIAKMVKECFDKCELPENLNNTLIALIPKVASPLSMKQMQPISLCNTLYKVVSKIIVQRLRPMMSMLVSPSQVSFIPSRNIIDNIIVAQEMLHKFRNSKGNLEFMAWKIDLAKAYDKLQWQFIESVLWEVGIRGKLLQLMIQCFTSVNSRVIFNGEATEDFCPESGLRQGDPLSPYLFVLCMEKLSHLLNFQVKQGRWKPMKICRNGPVVSHLFFVDDLILFGEASLAQAEVMRSCIDCFCLNSGQEVSFEKSSIFCSPNTEEGLAMHISNICGSPLSDDLGNYLGIPLLHSRVTPDTYKSLVEKVQLRLASWKSHTLSMVGRHTLIQSVRFEEVKLCESSFVSQNWMETAPKGQGLWAEALNKKYLKDDCIMQKSTLPFSASSNTWKGILYGAQLLPNGVKWRIGPGTEISFWNDVWTDLGALSDIALKPILSHLQGLRVCDVVCDGGWDLRIPRM
ncbi:hypothetical protein ACLB2K_027303 [Fragaria x ananassa]